MKDTKLGSLEEMILLIVASLFDEAYSIAIVKEYEEQTGNSINISAIHTVLYRLEDKGLLESRLGDAVSQRGGKRKRLFRLTPSGKSVLDHQHQLREQIRLNIPKTAFKWN